MRDGGVSQGTRPLEASGYLRIDPVKAFSEAKMPGEIRGPRARPCEHSRPWFLTPAELTVLFGLEAFELKHALARFPGFLVWTGEE